MHYLKIDTDASVIPFSAARHKCLKCNVAINLQTQIDSCSTS